MSIQANNCRKYHSSGSFGPFGRKVLNETQMSYSAYYSRYRQLRDKFNELGWDFARFLSLKCTDSELERLFSNELDANELCEEKLSQVVGEILNNTDVSSLRF